MKKGKPVGKPVLVGYILDFGAALNPVAASSQSNYQVATMTTERVNKKVSRVLKPITNFTVSYLAATDAVEIAFGRTETFPLGGQIAILEGFTDASGGKLAGATVFDIAPERSQHPSGLSTTRSCRPKGSGDRIRNY